MAAFGGFHHEIGPFFSFWAMVEPSAGGLSEESQKPSEKGDETTRVQTENQSTMEMFLQRALRSIFAEANTRRTTRLRESCHTTLGSYRAEISSQTDASPFSGDYLRAHQKTRSHSHHKRHQRTHVRVISPCLLCPF